MTNSYLLSYLCQDAEEVSAPNLADVFFSITHIKELYGDVYHIVVAITTQQSATSIEV